jgi:hypothetical protein
MLYIEEICMLNPTPKQKNISASQALNILKKQAYMKPKQINNI